MKSSRLLAGSGASPYTPLSAARRPGRVSCARSRRPACQGSEQDSPSVPRRDAIAGALAAGVAPMWLQHGEAAAALAVPQCGELTSAANGIQYCDVTEGTGKSPAKGSLIRCHYRGRLTSNNAVFDSSYDRGRPLSFKVGVREVIQGWDLGILGSPEDGIPPMKEGGKRVLVIPPNLAYGERGAGRGIIPPNASLIFDVELLGKR